MIKVIGITGNKRHGKGEVGAAIARLVPGTVQTGYADKLKISMMRALGFDRPPQELIDLANEAKVNWLINIESPMPSLINPDGDLRLGWAVHSLSGRELLQWFGTEGGRETFGDTFWIDQVLPNPFAIRQGGVEEQIEYDLDQRYPGAPVVAITDLRFDNEAERVKLMPGGEVWEVVRPQLVDSSQDAHASEAGVDPRLIDTTIINDDTLETLQWRVEQALELSGVLPTW